jgi:hypothetical protein
MQTVTGEPRILWLVRKVPLLVAAGLALALVVSIPHWSARQSTMWRKPQALKMGASTKGGWLRSKTPSSSSSAKNPACSFDYPGPLRPKSLDCYAEYFPLSLPFSFPEMTTLQGRNFSLSGVTWADASVPRVPIIVLFKDRVSVLMETLRSFYRYLGTPYEVGRFIE